MIRAVAADAAERFLNRSPAQIRWHLVKPDIKIILGDVVLCPVNQPFCGIEAFLRFFAVQSVPLSVEHSNQEGKRTSVQANRIFENAVFVEYLDFLAGYNFHKERLLSNVLAAFLARDVFLNLPGCLLAHGRHKIRWIPKVPIPQFVLQGRVQHKQMPSRVPFQDFNYRRDVVLRRTIQ